MKILHVLSNWKWTERAEPAADMAAGQVAAGARAVLACGRAPGEFDDAVANRVRAKGVETVVLNLTKHLKPVAAMRDVRALRRLIDGEGYDVVHGHMTNGHLVAGLAARLSRRRPIVVASVYEPEGPADGFRNRLLIKRLTDGLVVLGEEARERARAAFGVPGSRVAIIPPSIDTDRFCPRLEAAAARGAMDLDPAWMVVGLVSRIRKSRRLDVVLEAVARLAPRYPQLRLLVVGRGGGTAVEDEVGRPAEALGIRDRVVLAGYCRDERLVTAYRAMDLLAYPYPGTDKSCRTVRESLASGVPVVASRIGYLPALVRDGETGRIVELDAASFAEAIGGLLGDRAALHAFARRAAEDARARFSRLAQAEACLAFYAACRSG